MTRYEMLYEFQFEIIFLNEIEFQIILIISKFIFKLISFL